MNANNSLIQQVSMVDIVAKARREHSRKISQFHAIMEDLQKRFPNYVRNEEEAGKIAAKLMRSTAGVLVDVIVKKAMNDHKRRRSQFEAIKNDLALVYDTKYLYEKTEEAMKKVFTQKYILFVKDENRIHDNWLIKFMHIFAEIPANSHVTKLIPDVVILTIMNYADECAVWIDDDQKEQSMEELWRINKGAEKVLLDTLIVIEDHNKYLDTVHKDVFAVLTNVRLYFVWKNSRNYHIWDTFRKRSKIDEIIDYDTEIDKTTAIQIANNLTIMFDEELTNYLYLKIVDRLIGLSKDQIELNILLFSGNEMNSIASLFGMPGVIITNNPKQLISKLWKARNMYHYAEQTNDFEWKIIDFTVWNVLKRFQSNCFKLIQMDSAWCFELECHFQLKLDYEKWIDLIPVASKDEEELAQKNKILLQRVDAQNNIIKKMQLANDALHNEQIHNIMDNMTDNDQIIELKRMQQELQQLYNNKRRNVEKLDAEITRLRNIAKYTSNPAVYSSEDTVFLKEKQIEKKKFVSNEEWMVLHKKNQSLIQQLKNGNNLIQCLQSNISILPENQEVNNHHYLLDQQIEGLYSRIKEMEKSQIQLVINANICINELRMIIRTQQSDK